MHFLHHPCQHFIKFRRLYTVYEVSGQIYLHKNALHILILDEIGKTFEQEETDYSYLYCKVWYTCARKIGLATAQALHNVSKRIYRCWKRPVRDVDDRGLRSNCSSMNWSVCVHLNASSSFYDQATASRLPTMRKSYAQRRKWAPTNKCEYWI